MSNLGRRSPSLARRAGVFLLDARAVFAGLAVISFILTAIGDDSVAVAGNKSKFNKVVSIGQGVLPRGSAVMMVT